LDSLDRPAFCWNGYITSKAGWSLSDLTSMLRLNLFTYRDLNKL